LRVAADRPTACVSKEGTPAGVLCLGVHVL